MKAKVLSTILLAGALSTSLFAATPSPGSISWNPLALFLMQPQPAAEAPEPATWALMATGVGMVAVGARLRKKREPAE